MIIHTPETRQEKGNFYVTARIEYNQDLDLPSELWFRIDEDLAPHVSVRADAFVSSLLSVAREIREDIEVRGDFSPKLLLGLQEYQYVQDSWLLEDRFVRIKANNLVPSPNLNSTRANSFSISGGVDSSYTLWSLIPENQPIPEFQIRYAIYGEGLSHPGSDDLSKHSSYGSNLKRLVNSLGVELISVGSNLPLFRANNKAWLTLGRGRISIPLLFSPLISTHYVRSSYSYEALHPSVAHIMLDHLHSTETLRFFTHAANLNRFQKLKAISNWPPIHEFFQVCNIEDKDALNCCRCNKCNRTMMALDMLGVREKFNSFHLPLRNTSLLRNKIRTYDVYLQISMMAKYAWSSRNLKFIPFLYWTLVKYHIYLLVKQLFTSIVGQKIARKKFGIFG